MNGHRIMVFDTASMYFRAFFGLPSTLRSPDGRPVNAVRGLLDFIARLAGQYSPTHLVCAWDDDWRPAWRVELLPSYKAHRVLAEGVEKTDPDLDVQVPLIREALAALGIPVIGLANYEADDVAASLVFQFPGEGLVVTGDRDLFQLVDERVGVIYLGPGVAKHDLVDPDWVRAKHGVDPQRYVDFAVLRGDPSDGLPGLPGIGEKTASTLVQTFGDLQTIMGAAADPASQLAPRARSSIAAGIDYIARAETVVRAVTDLALPEVSRWDPSRIDRGAFAAISDQLNLGGSAQRILEVLETL